MLKVTTNMTDVIKQVRVMQKKLQFACKDAMDLYGFEAHSGILMNANGPYLKRDTGTLLRSEGYEVKWQSYPNSIRASHFNVDPVAAIQTWGAKGSPNQTKVGYPITPKGLGTPWTTIRGKSRTGSDRLIFEYRGVVYNAGKVNHGPVPASPFITAALLVQSYSFGRTLQTALRGRGLI